MKSLIQNEVKMMGYCLSSNSSSTNMILTQRHSRNTILLNITHFLNKYNKPPVVIVHCGRSLMVFMSQLKVVKFLTWSATDVSDTSVSLTHEETETEVKAGCELRTKAENFASVIVFTSPKVAYPPLWRSLQGPQHHRQFQVCVYVCVLRFFVLLNDLFHSSKWIKSKWELIIDIFIRALMYFYFLHCWRCASACDR